MTLAVLFGAAGALVVVATAAAYWSAPARGAGRAGTGSLGTPTNTTATTVSNTSSVSVSWTAARTDSGTPATGYYVTRVRTSDNATAAACGTSAAVPTVALTCADTGVADGTYRYVVTAVLATWTAAGSPSGTASVVSDTTRPVVTVTSITPAPNANGWNNSGPVTVNLSVSSSLGIAPISYSLNGALAVLTQGATVSVSVNTEGISTISAYATDVLGKVSQTQTVTVRIDRVTPTAPSAPILSTDSDSGSSATDNITNVTAPFFSGTAETSTTVTLYDGTTAIGSAIAVGGAYTVKSAILSTGSHSISAKATDPAGNVGPASTATTVTVDTTAPAVPAAPTLSAASDSGSSDSDRLTSVTTPVFTGTAEGGATVTLYSGPTVVGTAVASAGGTWSITSAALKTGPRAMTVTATDVAGNVSGTSTATTVTIDYTAPNQPGTVALAAASDTGRSATDGITSVTTPTVTGAVTPASTVTVYDGSTVVATVYTATNTYSVGTSALAEGSHSITATATDAAGNVSVASPAFTVTVDTTAPAAPSTPVLAAAGDTGRSSTDGITARTTPTFTGTTEANALVTLRAAGTATGTVTTTGTGYAITSGTLADGTYAMTASAVDAAGNVSPTSAARTVTIDTVAPAAPPAPVLTAASDTGTSATDRITRVVTPTFTGSAEAAALVTLYDGTGATGSAVLANGGAYTATTGTLADGSHNISARATDVAGNVSAASPVTTVLIDTTGPTVTINQAAGQADPTNVARVRFTVVFSEPVVGFSAATVTVGGTAGAGTVAVGNTGPQYDLTVSGMTRAGTVTAGVAAGKVTDVAGNGNVASTSTDNSVTYAP